MPDTYEVVFVDKIVGNHRRVSIDDLAISPGDFNSIVDRAKAKVCKYFDYESSDLSFHSLRRFPFYRI